VTDEEFAQLMDRVISQGHELSGLEFKGPGPVRDGRLVAQVVKAVLGMANRRDGGRVIIGVEDDGNAFSPIGISDDDLSTWTYDAVSDQVARYADPGVSFEIETRQYNGNRYLVIEVEEFSDIPVLCKRAYDDVLRDGACYVRTRRKPETSDIPTHADMRDLLGLAIEKGVRQFLESARRVGLFDASTGMSPHAEQEHFDEQLGELR
jgi:predicted HTH transcriptional regulator